MPLSFYENFLVLIFNMTCLRPKDLHMFNLRPQDSSAFSYFLKLRAKSKLDKQIEIEGVHIFALVGKKKSRFFALQMEQHG